MAAPAGPLEAGEVSGVGGECALLLGRQRVLQGQHQHINQLHVREPGEDQLEQRPLVGGGGPVYPEGAYQLNRDRGQGAGDRGKYL